MTCTNIRVAQLLVVCTLIVTITCPETVHWQSVSLIGGVPVDYLQPYKNILIEQLAS